MIFDATSGLTSRHQAVVYVTSLSKDITKSLLPKFDQSRSSSSSGQTGIIVVDIGTGNSWRHLTGDARTKPTQQHFLSVWGDPIYYLTGPGLPYQYDRFVVIFLPRKAFAH